MHLPEPIPPSAHDESFAGVTYHIRGELVPEKHVEHECSESDPEVCRLGPPPARGCQRLRSPGTADVWLRR